MKSPASVSDRGYDDRLQYFRPLFHLKGDVDFATERYESNFRNYSCL
jgi:hypothetical protein